MNRAEVARLVDKVLDIWPSSTIHIERMAYQWNEVLPAEMTFAFAEAQVDRMFRTPGVGRPEPGSLLKAWTEHLRAMGGIRPCGGPRCDGNGWMNEVQPNGNLIAVKCPDCPPVIRTPGMSPGLQEPAVACPPEVKDQMRSLFGGFNGMGDV